VLNGSKTYISNGINADLVIVAAKTDPENNPHAMTLFIVERGMEGFERGRNLKKMGLKAQDTAELFFNDVRVPKANVIGEPHKGFIYLMEGLAEERLIGACGYLASAQLSWDLTADYVRSAGPSASRWRRFRTRSSSLRSCARSWISRRATSTSAWRRSTPVN
jgi:alkylation response protein AidB-like acyl-CoA dehydrogenase